MNPQQESIARNASYSNNCTNRSALLTQELDAGRLNIASLPIKQCTLYSSNSLESLPSSYKNICMKSHECTAYLLSADTL